jgi:hypothetical protein
MSLHLSEEVLMNRKSLIGLAVAAFLLLLPAVAEQQKKVAFDGQAAFDIVKVLSTDAMLGRKSGEPGGQMAADYITAKLKEWGVDPAGPNGRYDQDMVFEYYEPGRGATLELITGPARREFVYGEDWGEHYYSGSGTIGAEIVFAGYGISAPAKDYDDYSGVDVKDKIVLFSTDTPRALADKLKTEALFVNRVRAAREHGARGAMTFRPVTPGGGGMMMSGGGGLKKEDYKADFVILSVEQRVVDFMFKHVKTEIRYLFQQIEATSKPQSFATGVRSLVNLDIAFDEKRHAPNVLGKIAGADPKLKDEYVIVGAHYDHLGIDMTGDVFNGADDNASGTAVVMEVARMMKLNKVRPKRTVVFALWAAEEEGLYGSKYYTEHPIYPLEKTVAYINLDMEGHGTGKVNFRGVYYAPEVWDILKARLPKAIVDNVVPGRGGPGGSDHTYFLYKGVPGYFVATDGFHFRTNRVGDVIDLIKPEILKKAGDFVGAAVEVLAAEPKVPILPGRQENYYWKYETLVNHETAPLDEVIEARKDVVDPDVDFQLAAVVAKDGLSGDALRVDILRKLIGGLDRVRETKGLVPFGAGAPGGMMGMMRGGPAKTSVLVGLKGLAALGDDLLWADVFAKQGLAFIALDGPGTLFKDKGLSDVGKKTVEALAKANVLLIAEGLDAAQSKALLEAVKKPVLIRTGAAPGPDVIDLVKKTNSAVGLVLGKNEDAAAYFKKLDALRAAAGVEYVSIVTENGLWSQAGKDQMVKLIGEMLRAKYGNEDLAPLFSGTFMRVLGRARS